MIDTIIFVVEHPETFKMVLHCHLGGVLRNLLTKFREVPFHLPYPFVDILTDPVEIFEAGYNVTPHLNIPRIRDHFENNYIEK